MPDKHSTPGKEHDGKRASLRDEGDPQPEAIHGGDMEDVGETEHGKRSGKDKIRANQRERARRPKVRPGPNPSDENRERLRTEGSLGGRQKKESSYQGGQGQKLPPPSSEDEA